MQPRCIALVLSSLLLAGSLLGAQNTQAPNSKPVSQQGMMEALRIGGLTTQELIEIVQKRGVAFQLTEQVEADLRAAGAAGPLIEAVRANYRPPAGATGATPAPPFSKDEIITLLQAGAPLSRIEQLVKQRGVSFALAPAIKAELTNAGADQPLLTAIEAASATAGGASPAAPREAASPTAARAPEPGAAPAAPAGPRLSSMKQVHKLYIEKMKNNLDQYLRAEFSKQLPERFLLVLNQDEADALLVGTGERKTGTGAVITGRYLGLHDTATGAVSIVDKAGTVLWASEAGDRSLLLGPLKRGGAREVASRLVQDLKKALEEAE
jgi:hypothetical protein